MINFGINNSGNSWTGVQKPDSGESGIWSKDQTRRDQSINFIKLPMHFCTVSSLYSSTDVDKKTSAIFPNPSSASITVALATHHSDQWLYVVDLTGMVWIKQTILENPYTLDISALPPGTYWVKTGQIVQKLIKIR